MQLRGIRADARSRAVSTRPDDRRPPGLGTALAAHLLTRAVSLLVLVVGGTMSDSSALKVLTRWDARWYARIAEDGYGQVVVAADGRLLSDYAFFPLYPALERLVSALTGLTVLHAGLLVSAVSSLVAAAGIYRVGTLLHGSRTGIVLVVLWSAVPVSVVQSMAYTESLFTALAAWSLYAVLIHRYAVAGVAACLAGLTRPMGVAVVAAVAVGALIRLRDLHRARRGGTAPSASAVLDPAAGLVLAPLGLAGYLTYVSRQRDGALAYLDVTHGWGNGFDGGLGFAAWVWRLLLDGQPMLAVAVLLGLALLASAVVATARRGYPSPVLTFTLVSVLLSFATATYFGSKPRYLLPVFTLLLWPSPWLARLPASRLLLVLGGLAVSSATYGAIWLYGPGPP